MTERFREQLIVVGSPTLIDALGPVSHLDVQRMPTLQSSSRPSLCLTWLRAAGLAHSGAIRGLRFPSSEMVMRAAVAGLGLVVVPLHFIQSEVSLGQLRPAFGHLVVSEERCCVVVPESKVSKTKLLDLRDWMVRAAKAQDRSDASKTAGRNAA